ncbi:MAG: YdeI/OmpD-associated family protein [Actinomycetota bacterium]
MSNGSGRPALDDLERVEVTSVGELRAWLQANHESDDSIWLVTYKKSAGPGYVARGDVLDELLCFGWIDGARRKLDDQRTMQLVGPRRHDRWAKSYRDRIARLQADGRVSDAGLAAIERAKAAGLWDANADVDALEWPDDLSTALGEGTKAAEFFASAAPSYQRNVLRWIGLAKTDQTRSKRIRQTVQTSGKGAKIRHL